MNRNEWEINKNWRFIIRSVTPVLNVISCYRCYIIVWPMWFSISHRKPNHCKLNEPCSRCSVPTSDWLLPVAFPFCIMIFVFHQASIRYFTRINVNACPSSFGGNVFTLFPLRNDLAKTGLIAHIFFHILSYCPFPSFPPSGTENSQSLPRISYLWTIHPLQQTYS